MPYTHDTGSLPFFRYSKFCALQWVAAIALIILGAVYFSTKEGPIMLYLGLALFFFGALLNEIVITITAALCFSEQDPVSIKEKFRVIARDRIPLVYSKGYNITACGIEKMHPFDSTKYKRTWAFLEQGGVIDMNQIRCYHEVELPNRKWLSEVMSFWYLFSLNYSVFVSRYVELPICFLPGWFLRSQLLEPMSLGTKGSVEAAYLAMTRGWAINLSGGFHHASRKSGEGFCIYPDITFITHYLRKIYLVKRILIVDLDAH